MKKYTQEEFDALPIDESGVKQCPTGDYSQIKEFPGLCSFGEQCSFSEGCSFGIGCSFGEGCRFGEVCSFGEQCSFSEGCSFGAWCSFGEGCSFDARCSFEGLHNCSFVATDRIGSRSGKTYFFKADEGFYVRCGCFFGTIEKFESRVKEVHAGTKHERDYLAAIAFAKVALDYEEGLTK